MGVDSFVISDFLLLTSPSVHSGLFSAKISSHEHTLLLAIASEIYVSKKAKGRAVMNQTAGMQAEETRGRFRALAWRRWGAVAGGSALALYGITRRSRSGLALATAGGFLAYAGTRAGTGPKEFVAESTIIVNATAEEAYRFWRNFENLPLFMRHLETVNVLDEWRSRWIAVGPLGVHVHWDVEIVKERENAMIAWRSLPGSDVSVDGLVQFRPAIGGRGTLVIAAVIYQPPAGKVGKGVAKLLGKDPSFLMRQDLRRFKALIEAGEIPTTIGQPHGPRSAVAALARLADADQAFRGEAKLSEVFNAMRRVS
jgi:uncharacterized membrane protein